MSLKAIFSATACVMLISGLILALLDGIKAMEFLWLGGIYLAFLGVLGGLLFVFQLNWPLTRAGTLRPVAAKAGPYKMGIALTLALGVIVWMFHEPLVAVLSGKAFTGTFSPKNAGFTLDQPTVGKWFFWFSFFMALILPFIAGARWLSDRHTRLGFWSFVIPSAALCFCLLCLLTLGFTMLLKYIGAMGFTPKRTLALVYGFSAYCLILNFMVWAVRRLKPGAEKAGSM